MSDLARDGQGPRYIRASDQGYRPDPSDRGPGRGDNRAEEGELGPAGTPCRFQQPEEQPQQLRAPFEGREPAEEEPEPAQAHGKEAERAARP